jgi:hypothetical protein
MRCGEGQGGEVYECGDLHCWGLVVGVGTVGVGYDSGTGMSLEIDDLCVAAWPREKERGRRCELPGGRDYIWNLAASYSGSCWGAGDDLRGSSEGDLGGNGASLLVGVFRLAVRCRCGPWRAIPSTGQWRARTGKALVRGRCLVRVPCRIERAREESPPGSVLDRMESSSLPVAVK